MVEWALPPTARNVYVYMHPFGRASPSVINRLIKAGSLLSPTCSSGDIRAIPSISQAATPMKPRANLGNRTRQPKGCANRIASQPQKQMAQPYRRHRMGPVQETRMNKISRTIQTQHTIFRDSSTLKGSPAGFEPATHHAWSRRARNPCATNTPTRAVGTMCEIKRRYQQASRIGLETESHLT